MTRMTRILGIDPGLQRCGWGVIDAEGNRLKPVMCGVIRTAADKPLSERLVEIHKGLEQVIELWQPTDAAIEETFVNQNPASALKLGMARGAAMAVPALLGLNVAEYPATTVKKSIVGTGRAEKDQVEMMVKRLLPGIEVNSADAADALAVAICHAHFSQSHKIIQERGRA